MFAVVQHSMLKNWEWPEDKTTNLQCAGLHNSPIYTRPSIRVRIQFTNPVTCKQANPLVVSPDSNPHPALD